MPTSPRVFTTAWLTIFLFFLLEIFILLLVVQEIDRQGRFFEFQTDQVLEETLRASRDGFLTKASDLHEGILGFGLYTAQGYPFFLVGEGPSFLDPDFFPPERIRTWTEGKGGVYFLVKSLRHAIADHAESPGYALLYGKNHLRMVYPWILWSIFATLTILLSWGLYLVLRLQQRAHVLQKELLKNEESAFLGQAGSLLAHEIKNPLASIRLATRLLSDRNGPLDELSIIEEESRRIADLVEKMRDLIRDPRGHPEIIELGSWFRAWREPVITLADSSGEFRIQADPLRFRSVVENLLTNAWESQGPEKLAPTVNLEKKGNTVLIYIRDYGPGIPAEATKRLFVPFHSTKSQGTGLGLALARRFAEASGGRIRLENHPEGGSMATIEWPEWQGGDS